jgi:hypothetical protein
MLNDLKRCRAVSPLKFNPLPLRFKSLLPGQYITTFMEKTDVGFIGMLHMLKKKTEDQILHF